MKPLLIVWNKLLSRDLALENRKQEFAIRTDHSRHLLHFLRSLEV